MARSPSLPLSGYDDSSSPDPLTDAVATPSSPIEQFFRRRTPPRSSAVKPRTTWNASDAVSQSWPHTEIPSSPLKTVTEHALSPWRIKVTVEAEPEDAQLRSTENITRTIKVPLKTSDLDGEAKIQRPDAEKTTAVGRATKRSSTPVRCRSNSRSRRPSVTNLDIIVLGDEGDSNEWSPRKSPRRKVKTASPSKKTSPNKGSDVPETGMEDDHNPRIRDFDIRQDTEAEEPEREGDDNESPELRSIDLNRVSVRGRAGSTKFQPLESQGLAHGKALAKVKSRERVVSGTSAASYPTPSPTSSYHRDSDPPLYPTAENQDFDTILESEGFTMIDVDSLPSVQKYLSSPAEADDTRQQGAGKEGTNTEGEGASAATQERPLKRMEDSDISSTVASSPPNTSVHRLFVPKEIQRPLARRQITPQVLSSPRLPSPPRPPPRSHEKPIVQHSHDAMARVVNAGAAFNDVVAFEVVSKGAVSGQRASRSRQSNESSDALFKGFESSAQHELRAGVRFGEELAKQHKPRSPILPNDSRNKDVRNRSTMPAKTLEGATPNIASQLKAKWQHERQAVSQQIQDAHGSQIIVIDSDEETDPAGQLVEDDLRADAEEEIEAGNETEGDPWLALASSPSTKRTRVPAQEAPIHQVTNTTQNETPAASPWKRGEGYDATTFLSNGDMSGMLWQPEKKDIRFGAGEIRKMRRRSGAFDVDRMVGHKSSGSVEAPETDLVTEDEDARHDQEVGSDSEDIKQHDDSGIESSVVEEYEEKPVEEPQTVEDETYGSIASGSTISQPSPVKIPVNFNDSTITAGSTILELPRPDSRETSVEQDPARPPTPRSAMKGTRLSLGLGLEMPGIGAERKVLFSKKSRWMNHEGIEGELVHSSSPELARHKSPAQAHLQEPVFEKQPSWTVQRAQFEPPHLDNDHTQQPEQSSKGILGWLWPSKPSSPTSTQHAPPATKPPLSTTNQAPSSESDEAWQPTNTNSSLPSQTTISRQTTTPATPTQIPSYLLPPSYPSDPSRTKPLSTSGPWTRAHLKTLHILYRKSHRPRFHAPPSIRPSITNLLKTEIKLDESRAGLGEFVFVLGNKEAQVVERFMQEVEWGFVCGGRTEAGRVDGKTEGRVDGNTEGRVGGKTEGRVEDMEGVQWGWSAKEIVQRLARVVVGEVIRAEEGRTS